jgi:hypothetical protein
VVGCAASDEARPWNGYRFGREPLPCRLRASEDQFKMIYAWGGSMCRQLMTAVFSACCEACIL